MHSTTPVISLMYHRIFDPNSPHDPNKFFRHLAYLAKNYPIVLPGEPLPSKLSICLTFDDAYFDFYDKVFPALKYFNLRAILAVPVKYILTKTKKSNSTRLNVPYPEGMDNFTFQEKAPFCTWQELNEMAQSGHVTVASHSYTHAHLNTHSPDLSLEVKKAKTTLQQKLNKPINYFVYPYGDFTRKVHNTVCKHHNFALRIGSSINRGWDNKRHMIYRIDAEPLWHQDKWFTQKDLKKWQRKYWLNRLRLK